MVKDGSVNGCCWLDGLDADALYRGGFHPESFSISLHYKVSFTAHPSCSRWIIVAKKLKKDTVIYGTQTDHYLLIDNHGYSYSTTISNPAGPIATPSHLYRSSTVVPLPDTLPAPYDKPLPDEVITLVKTLGTYTPQLLEMFTAAASVPRLLAELAAKDVELRAAIAERDRAEAEVIQVLTRLDDVVGPVAAFPYVVEEGPAAAFPNVVEVAEEEEPAVAAYPNVVEVADE
jgi:hypothetical protein